MTVMGTLYRPKKCWLMVGSDGDDLPTFGSLEEIVSFPNGCKDFFFVLMLAKTLCFCSQFGAYKLKPSQVHYFCIYATSLKCHHLFNCVTLSADYYIKSKYDLSGYLL